MRCAGCVEALSVCNCWTTDKPEARLVRKYFGVLTRGDRPTVQVIGRVFARDEGVCSWRQVGTAMEIVESPSFPEFDH